MSKTMYSRYWNTLRRYWFIYILGVLSLLITSFTEVLIPKFIQWATDLLTQGISPDFFSRESPGKTLNHMMIYFIITLVIAWLGRIGWRQLLARRTHSAGHQIKVDIWDTIRFQPLSFLHRYSLGDLMNRATGDWNKSRFIHGFTMVLTFDVVFFTILSLVSMVLIDLQLTIACLIVVPFLPKFIINLSKKEYFLHQQSQEKLSLLSDQISQAINTIRLQRSTNTSSAWEKNLGQKATVYADNQFQVLKTGWKIFLIGACPTIFAYLILFSFGLYRFNLGAITLGEFLAMQSYILLLQSPLFELGSVISEWQTGFASFGRVSTVLDEKQSPLTNYPKPSAQQDNKLIELEQLSYFYGNKRCIDNIDLTLKVGDRIGFTGPIGSGKSTLAHLVAGLLPDFHGKIKLLGEDIRETGRGFITDNISVVPQKPFLFAGTIRHNLCLDRSFSDHQLESALKSVNLWSDVATMKEGLDTWIGEWGINLSGGQKQRLAIARAILRPSKVLIFDDCLSAVDAVTEKHILDHINDLAADKSIIWTAHRQSTLALCHRIYEIQDGRLKQLV